MSARSSLTGELKSRARSWPTWSPWLPRVSGVSFLLLLASGGLGRHNGRFSPRRGRNHAVALGLEDFCGAAGWPPWKSGDGSAPGGTPRRGCPLAVHDGSSLTPCRWSQGDLLNHAEINLDHRPFGRVSWGPGRELARGSPSRCKRPKWSGGLGRRSNTYPVAAKRHTFEYLREVAPAYPHQPFGAITRVRTVVVSLRTASSTRTVPGGTRPS